MGSSLSTRQAFPCTALSIFNKRGTRSRIEDEDTYKEDHPGLQHIPDSILLRVVSYCNTQERMRASLVCRKWYRVCQDPSLWRQIDFSAKSVPKKAKIRDKNIIRIISRFHFSLVRHIDLSGPCCKSITNFTLFYIARHCIRLQTLNISNCKRVTDTGFELMARNCPYIEELDISNCTAITHAGIILAVRKLRYLRRLNISSSEWVLDIVLIHIARFSRYLNYLNIEGCKKVTDAGLHVLAGSIKNLKHINLRNTKRITNVGLENFLAKTPRLEAIELGFARKSQASISILEAVSEHCKNLVLFDVQDCKVLRVDDVICQIANHNPRLRFIAARQHLLTLTEATIRTLTKQCPKLTRIEGDIRLY